MKERGAKAKCAKKGRTVLNKVSEIEYSEVKWFLVNFGEILYLFINKKNSNDQEPELILTIIFREKVVIDKNASLK